jgi:hypothetical protein
VDTPSSELDRFLQNGGHIAIYLPGWVIDPVLFCAFNSSLQVDHDLSDLDTIFVLDGEICLVNLMANREAPAPRLSLRDLLRYIPQETVRVVHARLIEIYRPRTRKSEDVVDLRSQARVGVVLKQSVVVHIEGDKLGSWAERKFRGLTNVVRI